MVTGHKPPLGYTKPSDPRRWRASIGIIVASGLILDKLVVLVLDDNPHILKMLSAVVAVAGAREVITCASADLARVSLAQRTVDLILADAEMPGCDGYQFVRWLRTQGPPDNRCVPIVMVTGHTRPSEVMRARDAGATTLVGKPIAPQVLMTRIAAALASTKPFVDSISYAGPDRRVRNRESRAAGAERRRASLAID
jgi:DNA-binding response OmpR family regulator